ncbi:PAS/PAC sensor hybrid histidine kinase [Aliiruegeria haliotis]|uniref:Sensory/regulatory protein RpfC n=1 Tax=Aliiruegeria haliotis TaxID=1280846 RepID=A0A2T0RJA8_9RHOB|nr:ATP-binding protein [Aliiruegeria haliotis]PRY21202.1 PAS/PAC sensor hybrid histidine kinase [Aliiruegeria haliotis]
MKSRTVEADRQLREYQASRTAEGRFLSYCRGRSRHFWTRQLLVAVLFPLVLAMSDLRTTVLTAIVVFLGETLDCLVLRRYGQRQHLGPSYPLAQGITTLTGGIQALTICVVMAVVVSSGGQDARSLAGAICIAALMDAALLYGVHRNAALVRLLIYGLAVLMMIYQAWLSANGELNEVTYDAVAALLLIYVVWLVVRPVHKTRLRREAMQLETLRRARDLAHVNQALEESRQTTKQLAMVAEQANDAVIITTPDGMITWVNRAFSATTGYTSKAAVGQHVTFLNGPETCPQTIREIEAARRRGSSYRTEIVSHDRKGTPIWMEVSLTPVLDNCGQVVNFVSVERNIGVAKERERALAEARQKAEWEVQLRHQFLATMSHEIRTPMNGVIGTVDLLLDTDLDENQLCLLRTITSSGEALLDIVNDILDFSKLESGKLQITSDPYSPADCIRSAVEMVAALAKSKDLALNLVLPASLPPCLTGDAARLRQILLNLLGNAIKFTETGSIDVEVAVKLERSTCHLMISVNDTGVGIPADRLEDIFVSFQQADSTVAGRFGGTGLGLAISRLLTRAMGGEIDVSSFPGKGSTFVVNLSQPIGQQENPPQDPPPLVQEEDEFRGLRVLVAEDNRTNTLILERMLSQLNVDPIFAVNGRDAVSLFDLHEIDLVLMDVHMPILDGLEATRRIRSREAELHLGPTPIAALTANALPEDREMCLAAGMDGVITKPFRKKDIVGALRRYRKDRFTGSEMQEPVVNLAGIG